MILSRNSSLLIYNKIKLENEDIENIDSYELLKMIGKKRGMLVSGGEIDTERAVNYVA